MTDTVNERSNAGKALASRLLSAKNSPNQTEEISKIRADFGAPPSDFADPTFVDLTDTTDLFLRVALQDRDMRAELTRQVVAQAEVKSRQKLQEIDANTEDIVSKVDDFVIIGGGTLTGLAAAQFAELGVRTTVITDDFGGTFVSAPINLNSSLQIDNANDPDVPLSGGTTTPLTPANNPTIPGAETFKSEALPVVCKDGSTRFYPPAEPIGDLTRLNVVAYADSIITNQRVPYEDVVFGRVVNGKFQEISGQQPLTGQEVVKFRLVDKTGEKRTVYAKGALFLTGPGKEKSRVVGQIPGVQIRTLTPAEQKEVDNLQQQINIALGNGADGQPLLPPGPMRDILIGGLFDKRFSTLLGLTNTKTEYELSKKDTAERLADGKVRFDAFKNALKQYKQIEGDVGDKLVDFVRQQMRDAARELYLPEINTFSVFQQLNRFWQDEIANDPDLSELRDDVALWPFTMVFQSNPNGAPKQLAFVGLGDSTRTFIELVLGNAPDTDYPTGVKQEILRARENFGASGDIVIPEITILGAPSTNIDVVERELFRKRYGNLPQESQLSRADASRVLDSRFVKLRTEKAGAYVTRQFKEGGQFLVKVIVNDTQNQRIIPKNSETAGFDFISDNTGLEQANIPGILERKGFNIGIISADGVRCGKGDKERKVFIGGSASNFSPGEFPDEYNIIAPVLGANENIVSLWFWANALRQELFEIYKAIGGPTRSLLEELSQYSYSPLVGNF